MGRWNGPLAGAAVLLVAAGAARGQDADRIRIVAIDGETADGIPSGQTLDVYGGRDVLRIAPGGAVVFDGARVDGGIAHRGHFRHAFGAVTSVALTGEAAPPPATSLSVANYSSLRMGRTGNVVSLLSLTGGGTFGAYATLVNGARSTRVLQGSALPGGLIPENLGNAFFGFNADVLAVVTGIDIPEDTRRNALLRIVGGGAEELLLREDLAVPGLAGSRVAFALFEPIVHENGSLATVTSVDDDTFGTRRLLLLFPPPGQGSTPTVLARTRDSRTATGEIFSIDHVTFGEADSPTVTPRVVYALGGSGTVAVYDTAAGEDAIFTPTTASGDHALALPPGRTLGLAPCDGGQVVLMGRITGPDVIGGGDADGIWRYVPGDSGGTVSLELYEGMVVPDFDGVDTTVQQIYTCNVNDAGRIVAEVRFPVFQAVLVQDTPGGAFRVALRQQEEFTADGRVFTAGVFMGQIPSTFSFNGPGHDGRQSRLSPEGEFVFRGGNFNTGTGVFVLGKETPAGCNVTARVRGRDLVIEGDDCGAHLTVRVSLDGEYFLQPGTNATVNDFAGEVAFTGATGRLLVNLGSGADFLTVVSAFGDIPYGRVGGDILINAGAGDDNVIVSWTETAGSLQVDMGRDAGGQEFLTIYRVDLGRDMRLDMSDSETLCEVEGVTVMGRALVQHGDRPTSTYCRASSFHAKSRFTGGSDADNFVIDECLLYADILVDLKEGSLGTVRFEDCEGENSNLRVEAKRSGSTTFQFINCFMLNGSIRASSGSIGSVILIERTSLTGNVDLRTNGVGTTSNLVNSVTFSNSFADGKVGLKGKGAHAVSVGNDCHALSGIDVRLQGGIQDSISISNGVLVNSGGVRVQSKASEGTILVIDEIQVDDGALQIKGSNADDKLTVKDSTLTAGVKAKLGGGDDTLELTNFQSDRPVTLDGGPGNDDLIAEDPTGAGALKHRNFESGVFPEASPAGAR